jgi:hypothetical protein
MLEFGDEHRRDPVDYGCLFSINSFERSEGIKGCSGEDAGRAGDRRSHCANYATKAVEHWDRNARRILFREPHVFGKEASVVHQVHVRKQYALGLAGGAGSVLNVRGLIRIWVDRDPVCIAQKVVPLRRIEIDDVLKGQGLPRPGFFEDGFVIRVSALSV